ncbi:hypothetical protein M9H77_20611 [Catharanthus roseus]|uniref:Uncharacterized protein n=1 Tax=Catharanthus roseus TaxID=4058 RepID=A0ACC0AK15_CATRO|nr:hypothetical protein M9H77_20611 [Catharanthus roseus]
MASKSTPTLFTCLLLPVFLFLFLYSTSLLYSPPSQPSKNSQFSVLSQPQCNLFKGYWVSDPDRKPMYNESCPFHRNAWNCLRNQRINMDRINSWRWVPDGCDLNRVDPAAFLGRMRNKNIGFVGDSLNENFLVSFLCTLRVADGGAKKWKRKGAWRGAYFPKFNVTVAYHRAVLLSQYQRSAVDLNLFSSLVVSFEYIPLTCLLLIKQRWQPKQSELSDQEGVKGIYRVDIDVPADDWSGIADFYDILVFNTGHWWGHDKFPKETPLVFYKAGKPIYPPLKLLDGLKVVLEHTVDHIEKLFPRETLIFWRLQSPRHFYGGDWNQNGSCMFSEPLGELQLDSWFDPNNNGVNKEARLVNHVIEEALKGRKIKKLDLTHLSEYRADAHPAIWLGKKDAVAVWGQDCMHWCLPGVPDTWVDILSQLINNHLESE